MHSIRLFCASISSVKNESEWWCLQKVCITVPGVRPLPQTELARRQRAVELLRSGISKALLGSASSHAALP